MSTTVAAITSGRRATSAAVAWIAVVAVLSVAAAARPSLAFGAVGAVLLAAAWRWPAAALQVGALASLIVRPSLDMFSERRLGAGPFTGEPAVVFGSGMLLLGIVLLFRRGREGLRAWPDRSLFRAHVWLAATYGVLFLAGWRLYGAVGLGAGIQELARIGSIVSAFFILWWWLEGDPARTKKAWLALSIGAIPPIVVALWQLRTGTGFLEPGDIVRIQGTFSHPNSMGQFLATLVLIVVAGVPRSRGRDRLWRLAVAVGLSLLVALTYSRTAILVLATGLIALLLLQVRLGKRAVLRSVAVVAVFALLGWIVAGGFVRQRFSDVSFGSAAVQGALAGASENSFTWRLINWAGLIRLGLAHPVMGHGAGMTTQLNPVVNENSGVPFNAHDDFVRFFFEGGLLGLFCYVVYGALLCRWAVRRPAAAGLGVGAALLAMFFLTAGTTELSLHTANQYTLYALLALAATSGAAGVRGREAPALSLQQQSDERHRQPDEEADQHR